MDKRVLSGILCLFLLTGCYAQIRQKAVEKDDPNLWNFGQAKEGIILKHSFVLKNNSKKVLNIQSVNTSCGCTASEASKKTLAPGEEASIEVRFNSSGYSGDVQQFVYVHTDDLDNPILRFTIKAKVTK